MVKNSMYFSKTLLMMAGSLGAGKSTVALALGRNLGWPVIDKDVIKSSLMLAGLDHDVLAPLAYKLSFALCEALLRQGQSVILDTPLRSPKTLHSAMTLTNEMESTLEVIYCEAKSKLRNERLVKRNALVSQWSSDDRTDAGEAQVFEFLSEFCYPVDASLPVDVLVPQIVDYLELHHLHKR